MERDEVDPDDISVGREPQLVAPSAKERVRLTLKDLQVPRGGVYVIGLEIPDKRTSRSGVIQERHSVKTVRPGNLSVISSADRAWMYIQIPPVP
jgi:hypothetical protein